MIFSHKKPTEPGWYWCRNKVADAPSGEWEAVVRVEIKSGELTCFWLGGAGSVPDGRVYSIPESLWEPEALWAGPLHAPFATPYESYWSKRALELERELETIHCRLRDALLHQLPHKTGLRQNIYNLTFPSKK